MSVDVEVGGPSLCIEPRDSFLDLKNFLIIVDDRGQRERRLDYISGEVNAHRP